MSGARFESTLSLERVSAGTLLVLDAAPVKWSLPATRVLSITTPANWPHPVSSLDLLLGSEHPDQEAHVVVLQTSFGDCAFGTHHILHLETFESTRFLPLPTLVFEHSESHPMRYVIFHNESGPVIVLDVDKLYQMANITAVGSHPPDHRRIHS